MIHFIFANKFSSIAAQNKILITGGTGFLGAYIIKELLSQGFEVRALKRPSTNLPHFISLDILQKAEWVEGDILDPGSLADAMNGISTVIHSAAMVSFSNKDKNKLFQVNIEGTKNVVNVALEQGVQRFVYISSVAAIGRKLTSSFRDETAKWEENKANTNYSISKFNAELEVWRGFAEGLSGVILNPATILGYGNWDTGSCALFKNAFKEFKWFTNGVNGFADVEDVAKATVELMKSSITEERFIICNDNMPFKKLFDLMANFFEKKSPSKLATPIMSEFAWRLEKIKSTLTGNVPLLTKESARVANSFTQFDNSKLLKSLPGFTYRPLEETIRQACEKYIAALKA